MAHRALIAAVGLILAAGLFGCGNGRKPDEQKVVAPKPEEDESTQSSRAWKLGPGKTAVPTGVGRNELEKIAVQYRQLKKLASRKELPFKSLESLGWAISRRSRNLVEAFDAANRKQVTPDDSKKQELKAMEQPEASWLNWPEPIRDLERVAINAKRVGLAAGTWDEENLRLKLKDLYKVADRCLPNPTSPPPAPPPPAPSPLSEAPLAPEAAGSGTK